MTRREQKWPATRPEWILLLVLGLSYMLDMYNFIGLRMMLSEKDFIYRGAEALHKTSEQAESYTAYGMGIALILLLIWALSDKVNRRIQWRLFHIFRIAMIVQGVLGIAFALLCGHEEWEMLVRFLRGVWAFFLGFGLGISLTIVVWAFSRLKRTTTVTFLVSMGVAGALLSILPKQFLWIDYEHRWMYAFFPALVLLIPVFCWEWIKKQLRQFPGWEPGTLLEMRLNPFAGTKPKSETSLSRLILQRKFWRSFIWLLLGALNVRFSVQILLKKDFITKKAGFEQPLEHSHINSLGNQIPVDVGFEQFIESLFLHYLSFWLSLFFFGWLSWQLKSRRSVQFFLCIIGFIAIYVYANVDITLGSILLGIFSTTWLMTLLQSTEVYSRRLHFFVIVALPLFFRLSIEVLKFIAEQLNADIIWLGYLITGVSILAAALLWEDNFEGVNNLQVLEDQTDTNLSVAVLNTATRREFFDKIDVKSLKEEQLSTFSKKVNEVLDERLREIFEEWLYSFSIGLTEAGESLKFNHYQINRQAYRDLPRLQDGEGDQPKMFLWLAEKLIANSRFLASYAIETRSNGIVLMPDEKGIADYKDNHFQPFPLSPIIIPDQDAAAFWASAQKELQVPDKKPSKTIAQFKKICGEVEPSLSKFKWSEKIVKILILRALDMWRYPKKQYYVYFIIPRSLLQESTQQRAAMVLHTAHRVPVSKLDDLANCMTWILSQRALALALDAGWRKILEEQSHSMKTSFGVLKNTTSALNDVREDENRFNEKLQIMHTMIDGMDRINDFTLALMRAGDLRTLEGADKRIRDAFRSEAVSLRSVLIDTLANFEKSTEKIRFSATGHRSKVEALIPDLRKSVAENPALDRKVWVVRTGFEIVLDNLISNMLFYTDYLNPQMSIHLHKKAGCWCLTFSNNERMEKKTYHFIKENQDSTGIAVSQKAGIRTIKRIIGSPLFNQNTPTQRWRLDVAESSLHQDYTQIYLFIPNSDIVV